MVDIKTTIAALLKHEAFHLLSGRTLARVVPCATIPARRTDSNATAGQYTPGGKTMVAAVDDVRRLYAVGEIVGHAIASGAG